MFFCPKHNSLILKKKYWGRKSVKISMICLHLVMQITLAHHGTHVAWFCYEIISVKVPVFHCCQLDSNSGHCATQLVSCIV